MQTAATTTVNRYDAIRDEINTRKEAVTNARNVPVDQHLEQYRGDVTGLAESKLDAYRRNSGAMRSYNEGTESLLSPTRQPQQQHASRLRPPQQGRFSSVAPMQGAATGSNGVPVALASNGGDLYSDGSARGDMLHESGGGDASRDETIARLNKAVRAKNKTIQEQAKEVLRYKALLDSVHNDVDDVDKDTVSDLQNIRELADDLAVERRDHQAARQSLEAKTHEAENARRSLEEQSASLQEKTREVERHSHRLAELEHASAAVHEENLELSRRIQEMGRLADEQQAAAGGGPAESPAGEGEGEGEGLAGDRRKELEKLQQAVDMKTRQLEAVKERASKTSIELQYFKGQARSGRFKSLLLKLWWLLRTVGFLAFLLFVYVAVSEDAFRSRGVDVYRLAH